MNSTTICHLNNKRQNSETSSSGANCFPLLGKCLKRGKTVSTLRYDPTRPVPKFPLNVIPETNEYDSGSRSDPWTSRRFDDYRTVELYLKKYGLFRHHFDTYEHFVSGGIQSIIDDEGDLIIAGPDGEPAVSVNFSSINIRKPYKICNGRSVPVMPNDVRRGHDSYCAKVTADVTIKDLTKDGSETVYRNHTVCSIPVMLGSSICNLYGKTESERVLAGELIGDQGGYFIISGYDRVLTSQVKRLYNGSVLYQKGGQWVCEMRSMNVETGKSVSIAVHADKTYSNRIVVTVAGSKTYCAMELFKSLGVTSDKLALYVGKDVVKRAYRLTKPSSDSKGEEPSMPRLLETLVSAIRSSKLPRTKIVSIVNSVVHSKAIAEEAVGAPVLASAAREAMAAGISSEDIMYHTRWSLNVLPISDTETMFPHIGIHGDNEARAQCLGRMIRRLNMALEGKWKIDDRGDYSNKRIEAAGTLIADLFKMLWKQFLADIKQYGVGSWTSQTHGIERDFKRCFMSGFWGAKNSTFKLNGVVETMTLKASHQIQTCLLRKVKIYVNHDNKNRKIRELHPSTEYSLCISETVEGQDVGTRLGFAICAFVSCSQNVVLVRQLVRVVMNKTPGKVASCMSLDFPTAVAVNGVLVAYTNDHKSVLAELVQLRRRGPLAFDTSISYDETLECIDVWVDAGRVIRPVYDLEEASPDIITKSSTFDSLEQSGCVVFRDVTELSAEQIVLVRPEERSEYPDARYSELHPSCLYGVLAGDIVYVNHTQSPRACYMTCMARHSIGTRLALGPFAPQSYTLNIPQKPLVTTRLAQMCGFDDSPNGVNAIVAVLSYSGFNQEDSVIINRSSLQRGLFSTTIQRVITVETLPRSGVVEEICVPPENIRIHPSRSYRHLDSDGLPRLGAYIEKGDVIVGRVARATLDGKCIETSALAKLHEDGIVKMVLCTSGKRKHCGVIKIVLLETNKPEESDLSVVGLPDIEIGDKVCSSMAQKGTCGMLYNQEDMPFTADGMVPDIVINPHCMPSRMTINQYIASIVGKIGAVTGHRYDGSPFQRSEDPFRDACNELAKLGFDSNGSEVMYNGMTGERFQTRVFIGPVYYRRLTQLVRSANFASVKNNVKNRITRQPLNGRINDGGLRIGEMEKDTLLVHGAVYFEREKLVDLSDDFTTHVCTACKSDGLVYRTSKGEYKCRARHGAEHTCNREGSVAAVRLPAATRQLFHLCEAMNVVVKTEV